MNNLKIEEFIKARFYGIANRFRQLSKRDNDSLFLEHLKWLEWMIGDRGNLIFKKSLQKLWF